MFPRPARPDQMDRREALRRTALLLGGVVSAPTLAAMLAGCEAPSTGEAEWAPRVLTGSRWSLVATIAEHVIPATDTPGARAAGVHRFIDTMLAEYYSADERGAFLAGLTEVDRRAKMVGGRAFLDLPANRQRDVLTALDTEAYQSAHHTFFRTMKELTLLGYYTSRAGATQELKYARVPGRFDGCIPFVTIGRAWSV